MEKKTEKKSDFVSVDLSHVDMFGNFFSIHVDSTGNSLLKAIGHSKGRVAYEHYYKGQLSDSLIKKVICLTDTILKANYDSLYFDDIPDLSTFNICLTSKLKKQVITSRVYAPEKLNSLVRLFFILHKKNYFKRVDTSFHFESFIPHLLLSGS